PGTVAQPARASACDLGRQRLPRPACDRRPHPPPAREARAGTGQAALHPDCARRRVSAARAVAMLARPRIGALGLRGRIVGLVLVTTVATLVVAAVTLLGPLESRLRNSALKTLQHELPKGSTGPFASILAPHPADRDAL